MKTTYLIWKNPLCGGIAPDWREINGNEFYALVKSQQGKTRFFVRLENTNGDGSYGRLVMEVTKEEYRRWRKEKDHSDLVLEGKHEKGYITVSYNALDTESGDFYGEELLVDIESDFIDSSIDSLLLESLAIVKKQLSSDELWIIDMVYRDEKSLSEIAESLGMSKQAVSKRLNKVLTKLRNLISRKYLG